MVYDNLVSHEGIKPIPTPQLLRCARFTLQFVSGGRFGPLSCSFPTTVLLPVLLQLHPCCQHCHRGALALTANTAHSSLHRGGRASAASGEGALQLQLWQQCRHNVRGREEAWICRDDGVGGWQRILPTAAFLGCPCWRSHEEFRSFSFRFRLTTA